MADYLDYLDFQPEKQFAATQELSCCAGCGTSLTATLLPMFEVDEWKKKKGIFGHW